MAQGIIDQIENLVLKTKEGKVDWKKLNQNTIRWTTSSGITSYFLTIQITSSTYTNSQTINNYMMSIQEVGSGEMILQLQASQNINASCIPLFEQLFDLVAEKASEKSNSILKKLLGGLD